MSQPYHLGFASYHLDVPKSYRVEAVPYHLGFASYHLKVYVDLRVEVFEEVMADTIYICTVVRDMYPNIISNGVVRSVAEAIRLAPVMWRKQSM